MFTNVVWYSTHRPISGISDPPAMMVGQAVVSLMSKGRPVDVICSIMENGDTGRADIIVGNRLMCNDHWNGSIDCGSNTVTIRCSDDGLETLAIPIGWVLNYEDINSAQSQYSNATRRAEMKIVQDKVV